MAATRLLRPQATPRGCTQPHRGSRARRRPLTRAQTVVPGKHMGEVYDALAQRVRALVDSGPADKQHLIAVAGAPGAGKSTLASEVCARVNAGTNAAPTAVSVPMDGYHLTRAQLADMHDPAYAASRRGAYWTFDEAGFVAMVQKLRLEGRASVPSFDHGTGDPVPDAIQVEPSTAVVILEGNYLLLDYYPWSQLKELFDERWFVQVDVAEAMQRVERRHAATGKPPEVAATRVRDNDGPNALLIASTAHHADVLVPSLPLPLAATAAAPAAAAATTAATAAAPDGSSSEAQLDERLEDRRSWIEKFNDNRAA